jgi:small subunit ribosomal protein S1
MNENSNQETVETTEVVVEQTVVAAAPVVETVVEKEDAIELEVAVDTAVTGTAHDAFEWSIGKRATNSYSDADTKRYSEQYESSMNSIGEGSVIQGRVMAIAGGDVVLDVNHKSDGLIPLSEFRGDTSDLKIGDTVDVFVEKQEDGRGNLKLSRRKAKLLRAWEAILDSFKNGTVIKGTVISKTKGGLIVDCGGLETFLPGSQIDIKPINDYDGYVGKMMEFKVVKVNETIKNAVVSHKALIESDLQEQRETIIGGLEKGQVLEGIVKNITDFGAFLDLGGVDGLLYITDISWGRITHPNEVLHNGQRINVVVLDFDDNKKRISLGLKQLTPHPWEVLPTEVGEGSIVTGKIVNIEDYGAFLEIHPGVEGLVHVSEITWSNQPVNAREYFKLGQEYSAKVVTIDRDDRKMSLSLKQMSGDPWGEIENIYPVGSKATGEVKNLTPYGVFVELREGVGGMVHISDLSWLKRYSHPSEFTKVGNQIDIFILDVDKESRKLSLGHKQLEENPWDAFEGVFPIGSYHEGKVLRRDDKGAVILLPHGLEAFSPKNHIKKADNQLVDVEETLMFKVIEFNRDDKRILVSHTRYNEDLRKEADVANNKAKDSEVKEEQAAIKATQSKVEVSTLGDIEGLKDLKISE